MGNDLSSEIQNVMSYQRQKDLPCLCPTDKASGILFGQSTIDCPEEYSRIKERYGNNGHSELLINVGASKRKPCMITIVCNDGEISEKLTGFDKAVLEAICSLCESKCWAFTIKQVLETMCGKQIKCNKRSTILNEVEASIEKMRSIKIDLDWSKQAAKLGLLKNGISPKELNINENILLADGIDLKMQNGQRVKGYIVLRLPGLYRYSKSIRQVTALAPELLNVPGLMTSKINIELTFYIAQRIMQLANSKNARKHKISNVIILDTMFKHCEAKIDSRTELKRVRDTVYKILDHYKSAGLIMDYAKITEGQSVTKVEIVMPGS